METLQKEVFANSKNPLTLVISPDRCRAYVANAITNYDPKTETVTNPISYYLIDTNTGKLISYLKKDLELTLNFATTLVIHPAKPFLFVGAYDGNVAVLSIGGSGELSQLSVFNATGAGGHVQDMALDQTGTRLFVLTQLPDQTGSLKTYKLDTSSGSLTAFGTPLPVGQFPSALAVSPDNRFVVVSSGVVPGSLTSYEWNPEGGFPPSGTSYSAPLPTGAVSKILVRTRGQYIYVSYRYQPGATTGIISGFALATDGKIATLNGFNPQGYFQTCFSTVDGMTFDPSENRLYAIGQSSNQIVAYKISDQNGSLSQDGQPLPTGASPSGVAAAMDGDTVYVYVTNYGTNGQDGTSCLGSYSSPPPPPPAPPLPPAPGT